MKKLATLILITLFIILMQQPILKADFNVQPLELNITMTDKFINGNTSEKIIVRNTGDSDINVSWYIDHPTQDSIRENRTLIPDLNWVDLEPKQQIIHPDIDTEFYIYLNIPENNNNLNQHWEVWITFKQEQSYFFNFEHAVRYYIDTPTNFINNNSSNSEINYQNYMIILIVVFAISILVIVIGFKYYKRKKN
jgi:hypothetical protein